MGTYTQLDGAVIDLAPLDPAERAYLAAALQRFEHGAHPDEIYALAIAPDNPLLARHNGWVTADVLRHPLYRVLADLEGRAALRAGIPLAPDSPPTHDPARHAPAAPIAAPRTRAG